MSIFAFRSMFPAIEALKGESQSSDSRKVQVFGSRNPHWLIASPYDFFSGPIEIMEVKLAELTAKSAGAHDLKTGTAKLTPGRITQIQSHVPSASSVIEIRP